MKRTLIAIFALALSACTLTPPQPPGPEVATIKTDKFSKTINVMGPTEKIDLDGGATTWSWWLATGIDKSTKAVVVTGAEITVTYIGKDWCHYDTAADDTATSLNLSVVTTSVDDCDAENGTCIFSESYAATLPSGALKAHAAGYEIKLDSSNCDNYIVPVSAGQVAAQLAGISRLGSPFAATNH